MAKIYNCNQCGIRLHFAEAFPFQDYDGRRKYHCYDCHFIHITYPAHKNTSA